MELPAFYFVEMAFGELSALPASPVAKADGVVPACEPPCELCAMILKPSPGLTIP